MGSERNDQQIELTGAQIVVEELVKHGVDTVFGYPGGAVLPLYDELYKNSDRINHVISAHEQGAAHAADGYARVSGKTGVVIATSGPGATNLVTGIANAYLDSVPMVAITGNVPAPLLGKDSFQEVDIVGITQPVVKHNFVMRDVRKLGRILTEAFAIANSGRKGPVLIDIPKSVQTDMVAYNPDIVAFEQKQPKPFDLTDAVEAIKHAKRPYIYAGGGVISSGAEAELLAISERIGAPVGLSMMGLTVLPASYPLNMGMSGMHGQAGSTIAQSECDVMIALGVRFSDRATGNVDAFAADRTIVHVDIDHAEHGKNVDSRIEVTGDIKEVLDALLEALPHMHNDEWLARIAQLKAADVLEASDEFVPHNILATVREHFSDETVVATDVGQHQMWTMLHFPFEKPRRLLTSGGLGTMGYGMGAAIGGSIANDRKPTVLITSDGSFGMNLNELATAVTQKLPLVIVILNNGVLGMVRQWQGMFHGQRYSQTTLDRQTDFVALAKAFGAQGHKAYTLDELDYALEHLNEDGPTVIECAIDCDELVLPMIPPGGTAKDIITRRDVAAKGGDDDE